MIYIIITSSINNKTGVNNAEHRKNRYIYCIQSLLKLIENNSNIIPIIVENNGQRHTFLDELNCEVYYTSNNSLQTTNRGRKGTKAVPQHELISGQSIASSSLHHVGHL
jgi:hypothetical protein